MPFLRPSAVRVAPWILSALVALCIFTPVSPAQDAALGTPPSNTAVAESTPTLACTAVSPPDDSPAVQDITILLKKGVSLADIGLRQQARELYDKAATLAKERGNQHLETVARLNFALTIKDDGDAAAALALYSPLLDRATAAQDCFQEGLIHKDIGDALNAQGRSLEATQAYALAMPLQVKAGDANGALYTLMRLADVLQQLGAYDESIKTLHGVVAQAERFGFKEIEVFAYNKLAIAHEKLSRFPDALNDLNAAKAMEDTLHSTELDENTDNIMGSYYQMLGDPAKALPLFQASLAIETVRNDQSSRSSTLRSIGSVYEDMGDIDNALKYQLEALDIQTAHKDRRQQGLTRNSLGSLYNIAGDKEKALAYWLQSLEDSRAVGYNEGEATTLGNIGLLLAGRGEFQEALDKYEDIIKAAHDLGNANLEATVRNNLATLYADLGDDQKTLDTLLAAKEVMEASGDQLLRATYLNNLAYAYDALNDPDKADATYKEALLVEDGTGNSKAAVSTLGNLGSRLVDQGKFDEARPYVIASLALYQKTGDKAGEALAFYNLARLQFKQNDVVRARFSAVAALGLAQQASDPRVKALAELTLMQCAIRLQQDDLSLMFGVEAVNTVQAVRKGIGKFSKDLRASFAYKNASVYREFTEQLLVLGAKDSAHYAEAEYVLNLMKTAQIASSTSSKDVHWKDEFDLIALPDGDKRAEAILLQNADAISIQADAVLRAKLPNFSMKLTVDDVAHLNAYLASAYPAADVEPGSALDDVMQQILDAHRAQPRQNTFAHATLTQSIRTLAPGTMSAVTMVSDDHIDMLVTTQQGTKYHKIAVKGRDLVRAVLPLWDKIQNSAYDPWDALRSLDRMLLDPIESDIKRSALVAPDHVPTLLWSMDGVLHFLPIDALLNDKDTFLIERARNIVMTPEAIHHLDDVQAQIPAKRMLAAGKVHTYGFDDLPDLTGVQGQFDTLERQFPETGHGRVAVRRLQDEKFTYAALSSALAEQFPIVHIATHYIYSAGNPDESFLLLTDEHNESKSYRLTFTQLSNDPGLSFVGTQLVSISACSTAEPDLGEGGRDLDSLAVIFQKRGAHTVLASLWPLDDFTAGRVMAEFYRRWLRTGSKFTNTSEIEALRQARLDLLYGTTLGRTPVTMNGFPSRFMHSRYAHPYYWASYIMFGNGR